MIILLSFSEHSYQMSKHFKLHCVIMVYCTIYSILHDIAQRGQRCWVLSYSCRSVFIQSTETIIIVLLNSWRSGNIDKGGCEVLYYIREAWLKQTNTLSVQTAYRQGDIQPCQIREPSGKYTALAYQEASGKYTALAYQEASGK
jgi:hypothetical protein